VVAELVAAIPQVRSARLTPVVAVAEVERAQVVLELQPQVGRAFLLSDT
jgi:hypothetical protein